MMPLWNDGKAKSYKSKLEYKMCFAKETPEPYFDLADCNLSEVPSGVFSMCRVFLKQSLFLENNRLTSLQNGGALKDLSGLLVLNLQNNRLSSLPNDIHHLINLTDLNLENNQLKKLPATFSQLRKLRNLNLKGNRLVEFPAAVCSVVSLESLNVCDNPKVQRLPREVSNLTMLKCLQIDAQSMIYPSAEICMAGTEHIMKFLLSELGSDNIPSESVSTECPDNLENRDSCPDSSDLSVSYEQYHKTKMERQQNLLLMEEASKQNSALQADSVALASAKRKRLLHDMIKDQERMENELIVLQNQKDKERQQGLDILRKVEDHSAEVINRLITLNDHLKDWNKTSVASEEDEESEKHLLLLNLLQSRETDKKLLLDSIVEEENLQKEALKAAQLRRDLLHKDIFIQIQLIEKELANLTAAEIKRRDLEITTEVNRLAEHRTTLAYMLTDLLSAKHKRESQLKKILEEIEKEKLHEAEDFWLLQYKRLLNQKPASVTEQESDIDPAIKCILEETEALNFLPLFAVRNVSLQDLIQYSVDDLQKIGVSDEVVCQSILDAAWKYISPDKDVFSRSSEPSPSAPPEEDFEFLQPTAPLLSPDSEKRLWLQADCVICLDAESSSVFLPCGHVCCCQKCYTSVELCPMCRTTIETKFILYSCKN